jgi:acetoacetyl-CoA synthetase
MSVVEVPGYHGDLDDERIGMLSDRHVGTLAGHVSAALDQEAPGVGPVQGTALS